MSEGFWVCRSPGGPGDGSMLVSWGGHDAATQMGLKATGMHLPLS